MLIFPALYSCTKSQEITETSPLVNHVPVNTKFNIPLQENHTTGYLWQLNTNYDAQPAEYMNSVWHGNETGVVFNFESKTKGSLELEFNLIKYKDTLETKKFLIEVQ